jgi:hypothetical protein
VEKGDEDVLDWAHKAKQGTQVAPVWRALMIAYAVEIGDKALLRTHHD